MTAEPNTVIAADPLGIVAEALERAPETLALASRHLDPSLVDVLGILGFDKEYVSAAGSYLYDRDGRAYLDLHTGEGFASLGHNHPCVREALEATLAAGLLDGVQIHYSVLGRDARGGASPSGCPEISRRCSSRARAPRRWTQRSSSLERRPGAHASCRA